MNTNYVNDLFNVSGKNILVTGCSTGIGASFCAALAKAQASKILGIYNNTKPFSVRNEVEKFGTKFFSKKIDLDNIQNINFKISFDEIISELKHIDILVNCAGINIRNEILDYNQDDWTSVINVNLKSALFLSQEFARRNVISKYKCKIINVGSLLSFQGGQRCVAYTASKHGVLGITKLLANELGKYNINVNCIIPGYIRTRMTKEFINDKDISNLCLHRIPLKRWGESSDLNGALLFLASKASDYVNGASIVVDGGYLNT